jgi:hypothetical protein
MINLLLQNNINLLVLSGIKTCTKYIGALIVKCSEFQWTSIKTADADITGFI